MDRIGNLVRWEPAILIHDQPFYEAAGLDARRIDPGRFGSQYPRMTRLASGEWILVYTIYDNNGYLADPVGGNKLEIAISRDNARTWQTLAQLADPGRDLDNGQIIELADGILLLGMRSVRWQESYTLPVYRSLDRGRTWEFLSVIDENHGEPGSLGEPDKGVYEPHFYRLDDGRVSVMYANERHVTAQPAYRQTISQKISEDGGRTWQTNRDAPWASWWEQENMWSSVYATGDKEIAHLTSAARSARGEPSRAIISNFGLGIINFIH